LAGYFKPSPSDICSFLIVISNLSFVEVWAAGSPFSPVVTRIPLSFLGKFNPVYYNIENDLAKPVRGTDDFCRNG